MDWKDVGKTAARILPVLGTVLGGPLAPVAAAGGALLAQALGCEETPAAVATALSVATPEQKTRIMELENEATRLALEQLQEQNRHAEARVQQILNDKADARTMTGKSEIAANMQKKIAEDIMAQTRILIPLYLLINGAAIFLARWLDIPVEAAVAIGNLIGAALHASIKDRQTVTEYAFGAGLDQGGK